MKRIFGRLSERKGLALIAVYFVLSVFLAFLIAFFNVSMSRRVSSRVYSFKTQAFNLAEAGLDKAVNYLRAQGTPPIGNSTNPWGSTLNIGGGVCSVAITDLGTIGGNGTTSRRYRINSTGTVGTITKTVSNIVQTDNFARYIWFTDSESYQGTNVWFWSQDTLNGPTHTNSHFNIYGNPQFTGGDVQSVDNYIRYYNGGNNINLAASSNPPNDVPTFANGITLGCDGVDMPTQALNLRSASTSSGGVRLTGDTTVTLLANGTMNVTNSKAKYTNKNMALPSNGALFVDQGTLTLSGTLNGRLTVGASTDVVIPDNVKYNTDPRTNPSSTDCLGIISEGDVVISSSAPNNLEIDASIMALSTSFMVDNWWVGPAKGTLTMYGGIIQDERGPVGTFSGTTKVSGYSKNYSYDPRLLTSPPPFVPTTGDYISLSWED